jgi:membrane-associated phospholipid phosphatase
MNRLRQLDDQLFFAINSFARRTPGLHAPFLAYAKYGLALFALLLLAGVLIARRDQAWVLAAAGWACVATLLVVGLNQPVGHLFAEARPYATHPQILRLADVTTDFSFPSDHAVMGGAVATGLLLVNRRLGLLAALAAALMAFARVYIGAHYPWDVLGGLVLGGAVVLLGWLLLRHPLTNLTTWLRRQPGLRAVFPERETLVQI